MLILFNLHEPQGLFCGKAGLYAKRRAVAAFSAGGAANYKAEEPVGGSAQLFKLLFYAVITERSLMAKNSSVPTKIEMPRPMKAPHQACRTTASCRRTLL
jgi:hypothetical protein